MKNYLFFLLIIICADNTFASDAKTFANRTLVVIIETPQKKLDDKLSSTDTANYHNDINSYNNLIKKYVTSLWKINAKIEYKTREETNLLIIQKSTVYVYLQCTKYITNYADPSGYKLTNKLYNTTTQPTDYNKKQLPFRACQLEIKCMDDDIVQSFASIALPTVIPDDASVIYAIKSLAIIAENKTKGMSELQIMKMYIKDAPRLKSLTLLINDNDLTDKNESAIKEVYKYNYKLSDKQTINNAIINGDKTVAVTIVIPNADGTYTFKVIDAENCGVLGQSTTIPPSEYYPDLNNKIAPKNLSEFLNYVE